MSRQRKAFWMMVLAGTAASTNTVAAILPGEAFAPLWLVSMVVVANAYISIQSGREWLSERRYWAQLGEDHIKDGES